MNKFGYIYKFTCPNGKYYIGYHIWNKDGIDPNYRGSSHNPDYWNDIKLYGWDSFDKEIISICYNKDELLFYEIHWILELDALNPEKGYNLVLISGNGWDSINNLKYTYPEKYEEITARRIESKNRTCIEKYGTKQGKLSDPEVIKIARENDKENHGGKYAFNSEESHNKSLESNRRNHGGVLAWNTDEVRSKIDYKSMSIRMINTMIEKYGTLPFLTHEVRDKVVKILKDKYGESLSHLNNPEVKAKVAEKNKVRFIYEKCGKYKIMSRNAYGWKKNGYTRLCEYAEFDEYCRTNKIDKNSIIWL